MVQLYPEDMRMQTLPHAQLASPGYQIWLRAFLRALDECAPDDAKEFAERAVDIYQKRWVDSSVDNRERLDESEWLITLQTRRESEMLDQALQDQGLVENEEISAGACGGVANAIAGAGSGSGSLVG
ncbi:hypothetical protein IPR89_20800 [Xanthomonas perforans]|nr:hypothetical protein [Xanthomonas perforans]MBZ3079152.1 hypothetical protein [Xanthomonas perforans]